MNNCFQPTVRFYRTLSFSLPFMNDCMFTSSLLSLKQVPKESGVVGRIGVPVTGGVL